MTVHVKEKDLLLLMSKLVSLEEVLKIFTASRYEIVFELAGHLSPVSKSVHCAALEIL